MRRGACAVMLSVCILGPGMTGGVCAPAQEDAETVKESDSAPVNASPEHDTTTFHAYANLIQIPVLVLGPEREATAQVAADKFRLSIDGGPLYKVPYVRVQGDDPISLAILLDLRGSEDKLMGSMGAAIASLAPVSLGAKDHVSIYGLGCKLVSSVNDQTADRAALERGVALLLEDWMRRKHEKPTKGDCKDEWRFWDALEMVMEEMSEFRGRRVILAVTHGEDMGSHLKWNQVKELAQDKGVAVFGIENQQYSSPISDKVFMQQREDFFDALCQLSGGLVMTANSGNLAGKLIQFVKIVRGRYIVEFPRPYYSTLGRHTLTVTIEKSNVFIRPAGISVPLPDPAVLADPMTVPSDPSRTPQEGKRRPPQKQ